jgi:hypothetical protein
VENIHAHARTDRRTDNYHHGDPDGNAYSDAYSYSDAIVRRPERCVVATIIARHHSYNSSLLVLYEEEVI